MKTPITIKVCLSLNKKSLKQFNCSRQKTSSENIPKEKSHEGFVCHVVSFSVLTCYCFSFIFYYSILMFTYNAIITKTKDHLKEVYVL